MTLPMHHENNFTIIEKPVSSTARRIQRHVLETIFESYGHISNNASKIKNLQKQIQVVRNIPYHPKGGIDNLLDVYALKKAKKPLPIMIYIHGGGFVMCSKETHQNVALINAGMGYLVFNINYRLAPRHPFPAALEDVCRAYTWIIKHAHLFNGDIGRLTLAGESAGGNLVLALAVTGCYQRNEEYAQAVWRTNVIPKAVQVHAGLLQVSQPQRFKSTPQAKILGMGPLSADIAKSVAIAYLGNSAFGHRPENAMADPLIILESPTRPARKLPPIFAAAGTADICVADTLRLESALKQKETPHTIKYYADEMHAFHFLFWRKQAKRFWMDSNTFLNHYV